MSYEVLQKVCAFIGRWNKLEKNNRQNSILQNQFSGSDLQNDEIIGGLQKLNNKDIKGLNLNADDANLGDRLNDKNNNVTHSNDVINFT